MHKSDPRFRRTTILTVGFISFLAGLGLSRSGQSIGSLLVVPTGLLFLFSVPKHNLVAVMSATLLGTVCGLARGGQYMHQLRPYDTLYGQEVRLQAKATTDGSYAENGQLEFNAGSIKFKQPVALALPGSLKIQSMGTPAIYRGDVVEVTGKIYPTGGANQGKISYASLQVLGRSGLVIEKIRHEFVAGVQTALPEPQASFGLGLLVGQRDTLPDPISLQLSIVGLTHIIAVSGYNLTIIVRAVRRLLGRKSKYQSTIFSVALIGCFVLLTGFSASIVRAAIVSLLSLLAWYYGRTLRPLLLIVFAASLTAGWNPVYLWSDIGWYLSFLAFFGVLIVAPLIKTKLFGQKQQRFLGQVVVESLAAQIMTVPVIMYIFGEISLVALISNVVIVPLVPFAMVFSLIAGIAGMLAPVISGIFALPGKLLMTYMLDVINILSRMPHARVTLFISLTGVLIVYLNLILLILLSSHKFKLKYGKITDKNIIE